MDHTHSDAYYSTMDAIIATINRKLPASAINSDTLERLLDDVLLHFKYEEMQRDQSHNQ